MVAQEFLNLAGQFKLSTYVGVEDFADKLSFLFSVVILIMSMMVVTVKSYFFKPLSCYVATTPSGLNFENYLENYCWVHGTIPFSAAETIPDKPEDWFIADNERRITYYQWVPFILGLQCIMFYIPRILWQVICYNKTGTDIESLINDASKASSSPPAERKGTVEGIARMIEDMIVQHRDYRQGKVADFRRKIYNACNFCVISKHMGTWLVLSYMFVKCLYCINVIGQLFIMKKFLGFHESTYSFGLELLNNMIRGKNWHISGIFPRVAYCYVADIRHLGAGNNYVGQCALPINMLNEKIYVFLWFWVFFVGIMTIISIPLWFFRLVFFKSRSRFIKKFLLMSDKYKRSDKTLMNHFVQEFLRYDGVFLIRMIFINAGDLITSDIICRLWEIYKDQYKNIDFRDFYHYTKPMDVGTTLRGRDFNSDFEESNDKEPIANYV